MSAVSRQDAGPAPPPRRARVLARADLPHTETSYEFAGYDHGEIGASVIVIDAPPGSGPRLHRHPYTEVFVVLEGQATFIAGEDVLEAGCGQVVVVPAGVPHKFVNSGPGRLRQVDIHPSGRFITEWLDG
ncbi:MAG TPA: cupin domain-containing protein [Thermomicrobiales bacterium]|nr:cupin domain-containing protein [Thermomicrobiales bacterium]